MYLENWIRLIAGCFVLISLALGLLVSQYWFIFTAFVGFNLAQSALTGFCPMEIFLKKLGMKEKGELQKKSHEFKRESSS